jgi:hypothetical protein
LYGDAGDLPWDEDPAASDVVHLTSPAHFNKFLKTEKGQELPPEPTCLLALSLFIPPHTYSFISSVRLLVLYRTGKVFRVQIRIAPL